MQYAKNKFLYVCMYIRMYVCMYVCTYVCMYALRFGSKDIRSLVALTSFKCLNV